MDFRKLFKLTDMYVGGRDMNLRQYIDYCAEQYAGKPDWQWDDEGIIFAVQDYLSSEGEFSDEDVITLSEFGFTPEDFADDIADSKISDSFGEVTVDELIAKLQEVSSQGLGDRVVLLPFANKGNTHKALYGQITPLEHSSNCSVDKKIRNRFVELD